MKFNFKKTDYTLVLIVVAIIIVVFFILPKSLKNTEPVQENQKIEQIETSSGSDQSSIPDESGNNPSSRKVRPLEVFADIVLIGLLIFMIYLFYKRSKGEDLAFVFIRIKRNKTSNKKFLQVSIYNLGKFSLGIHAPNIEFYYKNDVKKYTITKVENQVIYPLTLPVKQGHRLNINVDKFYTSVSDLEKYKTISMVYTSLRGKKFKSNKVRV